MRITKGVLALAATSLALFALGGVGVSSATAEEPTKPCEGTNIEGQGSSLQKIAQEVWISGFETNACPGGAKPKVKYLASGSSAGLEAFGVGGAKKLNTADAYIGTDDAPSGSFSTGQIGEIETATKGESGAEQALVIPVAQAAIAIIVHPPSECLIKSIRNHDLEEVWNGKILEWSGIDNVVEDTAGACKHAITRVTREDGSGTTYQFKHYLFEINKNKLPGTIKGAHLTERTWEELQPEPEANVEWPEGTGFSTVVKPALKGGGEEVKKVKETEGSIGYANLGDARAGFEASKLEWVEVQTNGHESLAEEGGEHATYAWPGTAATEPGSTAASANCAETEYTPLPTSPTEPDRDWSKVYGGHPKVGKGHYPICTITWDVALSNYFLAGYFKAGSGKEAEEAALVGQTAYDYLNYVVATDEGQEELSNKHDYLALTTEVQEIAEEVAKQIGGGTNLLASVKEAVFGAAGSKVDIKYHNDAPRSTTPGAAAIDGANAGNYDVIANTCTGNPIAVGGECLIEVEYLGGTRDAKLLLPPGTIVLLN